MINEKYLFLSLFIFYSCISNSQVLKTGKLAPDFTLEDHNSIAYTLSDYRGKSPVIIYFYPKANTPGCTKQACGIRDNLSKFNQNQIKIFGISVDSKDALKEFVEEHNLNFPLLSDNDKKVSKAYNVLNMSGLSSRVTYIIDKEGKIAHILNDINIDEHAEKVLELAIKLK